MPKTFRKPATTNKALKRAPLIKQMFRHTRKHTDSPHVLVQALNPPGVSVPRSHYLLKGGGRNKRKSWIKGIQLDGAWGYISFSIKRQTLSDILGLQLFMVSSVSDIWLVSKFGTRGVHALLKTAAIPAWHPIYPPPSFQRWQKPLLEHVKLQKTHLWNKPKKNVLGLCPLVSCCSESFTPQNPNLHWIILLTCFWLRRSQDKIFLT